MSRKVRNSLLESRSSRLRLPVARKPAFVRVAPGISLGYRRNQSAGTWVLRVADGRAGSWTRAIGFADDHDEADGHRFFDYWQAQERAKTVARRETGAPGAEPITVRSAADTYLDWLTAKNRRTAADTRGRLNHHFLPTFGDRLITSLTKTMLDTRAGRPPGLPETPFGKGRPLGLAMGLPVVILLKLALPLLRYQRTWRQNWGCSTIALSYPSNRDRQPFS